MKSSKQILIISLFLTIILFLSCSTQTFQDSSKEYWFLSSSEQFDQSKPWWGQVHLTTSTDGNMFNPGTLLADHSGFPIF